MLLKVSLVVLLANFMYCTGADVGSFIDKCKLEDTACLKKSTARALPIFANGLPDFGVKKMDPFFLKELDSSSETLKLELRDLTVKGVKDCTPKKVDMNKSKLSVTLHCTVDITGLYEMKGVLLFIPIEGKGDAHVNLKKIIINGDIDIHEKTGKDGKKYYALKTWKHSFDLKEKSTVELSNLFNGNEVLGQAAKELLANNGNEIIKEVGGPIIKAIIGNIIDNINAFFKKVPVDDLVLE